MVSLLIFSSFENNNEIVRNTVPAMQRMNSRRIRIDNLPLVSLFRDSLKRLLNKDILVELVKARKA